MPRARCSCAHSNSRNLIMQGSVVTFCIEESKQRSACTTSFKLQSLAMRMSLHHAASKERKNPDPFSASVYLKLVYTLHLIDLGKLSNMLAFGSVSFISFY